MFNNENEMIYYGISFYIVDIIIFKIFFIK